jgi:hypothetical protein
METGLNMQGRRDAGSWLVVAGSVALLIRAMPLIGAYAEKLGARHSPGVLAAAAAAGVAAFGILVVGLRRRPRAMGWSASALGLLMAALSGNLAALAIATLLLGLTLLLGDAVVRVLRGLETESGELTAAFSAGVVAASLLVLLLGEAGLLGRTSLGIAAAVLLAVRRRRIRPLFQLLRASVRLPRGGSPGWIDAAWLAFAAVVLLAVWAAALGPDVLWDSLAYHLPEARDVASSAAVLPLADLAPHSLLWRNHETYLALGFFFGGERVVQLLQLTVGLCVFGAALALARRLGAAAASPLIVLALAAFPTAMLQLRGAYVDWPAALLVTAAAAQAVSTREGKASLRLAGFLFGGAVATKIFALCAAPALLILALRAHPGARRLAAAGLCVLIPLLPWIGWSQRRTGSFVVPYADSPAQLTERIAAGHYFTTSPASGAARPPGKVFESLRSIARLPYDLVYHSSRYEANGDGYNGILALLLLLGLLGWDGRRVGLFLLATLPFLIPWSLLYLPSIRYLFPVFPMYAVFTAEGMRRMTGGFARLPGKAAGLAVLCAAAAFPVQLGSGGQEWKVAFGRVSREQSLAARSPAWPLWSRIGPADRVILVGENDRFHCPAAFAWRDEFLPIAAWGRDRDAWLRGLSELGITHILWREDRRPDSFVFALLADRLEPIARDGPAVLYRVRR